MNNTLTESSLYSLNKQVGDTVTLEMGKDSSDFNMQAKTLCVFKVKMEDDVAVV